MNFSSFGLNLIVGLYNRELRWIKSIALPKTYKKVRSISTYMYVHVLTLPSIFVSVKNHSFRSYFQVQEWIVTETHIQPTDWGWTLANNKLVSLKIDLPLAKCSCKQNDDTPKLKILNGDMYILVIHRKNAPFMNLVFLKYSVEQHQAATSILVVLEIEVLFLIVFFQWSMSARGRYFAGRER